MPLKQPTDLLSLAMPVAKDKDLPRLRYSCYKEKSREMDAFVHDHAFTRILSGEMLMHTASGSYNFSAGDTVLIKRNQLVKAVQLPPPNGEFKSVSVFFDQPALSAFSVENRIGPAASYHGESVLLLSSNPLYESYASSLAAYQQGETNKGLAGLKVKEALMLILHLDQGASALLFDFHKPGKTDLENYMNTHFRFNAETKHFAYLTGRSLATFKRDFTKVFNTSPGSWLQQRRLKEAHYLIKEKRMKVSEVYPEVGFEDLSHFSFAFKKAFGKSPSLL